MLTDLVGHVGLDSHGSASADMQRASSSCCFCEAQYVTRVMQLLMTRPRDEWRHDVTSRYRALEQFSKEDARLQFLRILRSLPYGMFWLCVCLCSRLAWS